MIRFFRSASVLAAASLGLAAATPSAAIVIRHDVPDAAYLARESDFPAVFGLYRTKTGKRDCGATVIAPRWAVTAAHCTEAKRLLEAAKPGGPGYEVTVAGKAVRIDRVVVAPKAASGPPADIALLRFAEPVTHVAPIQLYRAGDELGRIVVMPGWGVTANGQAGLGVHDGLFRTAENVVDRVEGGRLYWRFDAPGDHSAALTLEGISGPGDSGGPALLMTPAGWALTGVSSSQIGDGPEGLYGVTESFVRVSAFAAWIDAEIRKAP